MEITTERWRRKLLAKIPFAIFLLVAIPSWAQDTEGKASYYHNSLHGRRMSNGQPYDKNKMTCAHRTLPFGTKLRVTNPTNGRQVIVEVTDRGPFVRGRIIDLSYAAARELGTLMAGVGLVQIEILPNDIELPYMATDNTLDMETFEYGAAGVCYEFIPEWKKEKKTNAQTTTTPPAEPKRKPVETKKGASRTWTDFFRQLRSTH